MRTRVRVLLQRWQTARSARVDSGVPTRGIGADTELCSEISRAMTRTETDDCPEHPFAHPCYLLPVQGKGQEYVPRHAAKLVVAGVHENHTVHHGAPGGIERTAVRGLAIHGLEFAGHVRIPQDCARRGRVRAYVAALSVRAPDCLRDPLVPEVRSAVLIHARDVLHKP